MRPERIFQTDMAVGYLAAALLVVNYLWPKLKSMDGAAAMRLIATIHSFRYFGLSFLLTGFVGAGFPHEFAVPSAIGDLATSLFALATVLSYRTPKLFWPLAWIFNIVGLSDLIMNTVNAVRLSLPANAGQLGASYAIVMLYVPLLVATHVAAFIMLSQSTRRATAPTPIAAV
jgi:hypothetical protein